MGGNIFGNSISIEVMSENVQSKNTEKSNAGGFDRFLSLYALCMCTDCFLYVLHFYSSL